MKGIFIVLAKTSHERALQIGSPYEGTFVFFAKTSHEKAARHSRLGALMKGIFIVLTKTSHERALQTGSPYEGNLYRFGKNIARYAKGAYFGRPRNSPTKAD